LGSEIACFESRATIEARIWVEIHDRFWGDWVELGPVYGEAPDRVLGLSDFFRHFRITFESGGDPPSVRLERA
jgi:hypothetical protein